MGLIAAQTLKTHSNYFEDRGVIIDLGHNGEVLRACATLLEAYRTQEPNSYFLSNYGWPHADLFLSICKLIDLRLVGHIVSVKNNLGLGYFARRQHEAAYLLAKGQPAGPEPAGGYVYMWECEPLNIL